MVPNPKVVRFAAVWGLPFLAVGSASLVTLALGLIAPHTPFFLYLLAVMFTAWWSGTRSAIVALILATVVLDYFVLEPVFSFLISLQDVVWLAAFDIAACVAIAMNAARREAILQQESAVRERQAAVLQVEQLKQLLPSCGACRELIDDPLYWGELNAYSQKATRSEWVCARCSHQLYPEHGGHTL